ncbi:MULTISPECIES: polysaccharide deacetylase family protein [unclassified Lysinibacillus]|uniref:polysaccharide deacetylase family protein n=1 Tax=unclassified Lysinibacillus TaxID=2636778 RepID=UPI00382A1780
MKKKVTIIATGFLFVFLLLFGTYKLMNSRAYQLFGNITNKVETTQKVIALTFDDGPTDNVNRILPLLEKYHAKATFFLIGEEIEKHPDEAKKIAEEGHQIGNHTYSHNRMVFKTPSYYEKEIEKTDLLIRNTGFKGEIDVRPPNGKKLIGFPYYLKKHNRETITWNLEPDSYYNSAIDKVNYVKENIEPGSIILIHPMYDKTDNVLETIEGILQELSKDGYTFVTMDELQDL